MTRRYQATFHTFTNWGRHDTHISRYLPYLYKSEGGMTRIYPATFHTFTKLRAAWHAYTQLPFTPLQTDDGITRIYHAPFVRQTNKIRITSRADQSRPCTSFWSTRWMRGSIDPSKRVLTRPWLRAMPPPRTRASTNNSPNERYTSVALDLYVRVKQWQLLRTRSLND